MAMQQLFLRPERDTDGRSTLTNVRAHQRENGHSHALWILAVLAVTLVVGLLVSLLAPGASALAFSSRSAALPHAVSAAVGPEDPAAPAAPVTWGVRPADTVHGTERPNYAYSLEPGASLDDGIIVSNYTQGPLTFRVYAADGFMTDAGELDLLPA
ncbi:MAG: hypothetical protein K0R97_1413, partial [Oerskovia sp.]|nr:hypothetical protein [Oerskovia sp.]